MVGNIVDVGWATIKSGCLPITGSAHLMLVFYRTPAGYTAERKTGNGARRRAEKEEYGIVVCYYLVCTLVQDYGPGTVGTGPCLHRGGVHRHLASLLSTALFTIFHIAVLMK
jgi:hypothetical protein